MRIRPLLGGLLGSVTVLVVGWQTGAAAAHNSALTATSSGTTSSSSTSTGTTSGTSTSTTAKSGTFTGTAANTQFGPVQVKIVVANGTITDVVAVQLTNRDGRSVQISNYAAPILRTEVLKAQSAKVSTVGGATYTSDGYLTSLQSAIDQAGL